MIWIDTEPWVVLTMGGKSGNMREDIAYDNGHGTDVLSIVYSHQDVDFIIGVDFDEKASQRTQQTKTHAIYS